ncbi:MAG: serine/threonine protein kinase [Burkholderiales bacterium]|nr:serine/threonine protein kinase [Burkholderiales bacterium]MDE2453265.1 serine/threonine protein kinase [Burkholderiales bacterium]
MNEPSQFGVDDDSGFAPTQLAAHDPHWATPADSMMSLPFDEAEFATIAEPHLAPESAAQPTLSHIGRYALKRVLAEGDFGSVHEAWDPLLSRRVVIKTLDLMAETAAGATLDALFLNEARAAAGLAHPYIVTIFDAGLSAAGVYIAMERLRGKDLRQALLLGWKPKPALAAQLVRRVAGALAYAHARGVVHCDIKPANIFLTRRAKPKVLDFGIARIAHRALAPAVQGLIAGTPHYLAPEQIEGGVVDARTDIYALGVVLYELLAGRKAFPGSSLAEISSAVLAGAARPLAELRPDLPPGLVAVVERAMARHSEQRYARAADMALDLRHWHHAWARELQAAAARRAPWAAALGGAWGAVATVLKRLRPPRPRLPPDY